MCEHLGWSDEGLKACVMNKTNDNDTKFNWANRDFDVDVDMISNFISSFLLEDGPNCSGMYERAEGNDFVIHNTYCSKEEGMVKRANQYFHLRSRQNRQGEDDDYYDD